MLLTTFEILVTIVTPLLALYLRGRWPPRTVTACLVAIPVVWYLTYAPIHELSHALGAILVVPARLARALPRQRRRHPEALRRVPGTLPATPT